MSQININAELPIEGTLNDGPEEVAEGAVESAEATEESVETETETPTESPTEEKPATTESEPVASVDTALETQLQGLQQERVKLLKEIQELRGQRRDLKKEELVKVNQEISDLKDVAPQDVELIEKVLRSKGYMRKDEVEGMTYKAVQDEELNTFLAEFPEYKPENDPNDINWNSLQRALAIYAKPSNPRGWKEILRKAHKDIAPVSSDRTLEVKKQQVRTAGVGQSGVQKSSSRKTFSPSQRQAYLDGGWSKEEIDKMEENL